MTNEYGTAEQPKGILFAPTRSGKTANREQMNQDFLQESISAPAAIFYDPLDKRNMLARLGAVELDKPKP